MNSSARWAIVLAGGDGTRLSDLTRDGTGTRVPKQYCSLFGSATLLGLAVARAERLVPSERIVVSVTENHRRWWQCDLAELPDANIVSQPSNRGTAPGLLLPLLEVLDRDPEATVVVVPSDHYVADDVVLETVARRALDQVGDDSDSVVVLAVPPDGDDTGYGWIVPSSGHPDRSRPVAAFVEKPDVDTARALRANGALWNTFVVVARARRLLELFEEHAPRLVWAFHMTRWDAAGPPCWPLERMYRTVRCSDFSKEVLEPAACSLRVLAVPPCGWCDLGTPKLVARWFRTEGVVPTARRARLSGQQRPVLADAIAQTFEATGSPAPHVIGCSQAKSRPSVPHTRVGDSGP